MDNGLLALVLAAQLQQVPVDAARLAHEFATEGIPCDATDLLRAAGRLGFKARQLSLCADTLDPRCLPAIGISHTGEFFVIARRAETDGGVNSFLIQHPGAPRPESLDAKALAEVWSGEVILLRRRDTGPLHPARRFNLRWFLPALSRYRRLFIEVLVASFFLQLFALVTPLFFQVVMDKVLVHRGFSTLNVLAAGFAVIVLFEAVIGGLRNYLFSHTSNRVDVELGAGLFHHLTRLPLSYFEARQVGHTVARVRELETLRNFITGTALTLLIDVSFSFVFLAVLWYYSPTLTWIVLGALPVYVILSAGITPQLKHRLDEKFRASAENQAFLTETVTGIQTVKAQAVEPQLQRRWEDQLASYVNASFSAQNLNNIAGQAAGLVSKITTLLIIWWGAHLVIAGALTVGQLVAFNMIAGRLTQPVLKLVQLWQDFQQAGISLERLGDILNTPTERGDRASNTTPATLSGAVTLERLRFRYRSDGPLVLDELSLAVPAGALIGIVGRSGSGKSTLAKVLQRLHVPEAGRVLLDGMDLSLADNAWLRRNVGVVQQESFLFNRSVRDNIALANPGVPFERIVICARAAGAHDFILELQDGYDTLIGEQGCNLSGGQRQRIAIARALLNNPRILIMDEATSALDYESERVVQENMGAICSGRTVFIIAHRLSTVRHCDRIIVMDQGRLVESGTHEALIDNDGYYARLHSYQNHTPRIRALEKPPRETPDGTGLDQSGAS
ncbi:MAG: type I secretion system permease/ATPase [Halioglobus sp.]|nr:type I secretion system permease/ATPase [Halioglobus sp.]